MNKKFITKAITVLLVAALAVGSTSSFPDQHSHTAESLYEEIERADAEKTDAGIDLAKMRIANEIRYTEKDIVSWLKSFCRGDLFDEAFHRRIIDTFINSIYLYDDRVVIFYNIKGGKQVSYIDMLSATEDMSDFDWNFNDAEMKTNPDKGVRFSSCVVEHLGPNTNPIFIWAWGFRVIIYK